MSGEAAIEPEFVPISALQHYLYCVRQCALIHVERAWAENGLTAEGRLMHARAHAGDVEARHGAVVVTAMPLRSLRLGLVGVADVVELRRGQDGRPRPYPIEYKRGRPKAHRADEVQLCAQAIALEEMFATDISEGALFYGETRRRSVVALSQDLRELTRATAAAVHVTLARGATPRMRYEKSRCDACSLLEICRPRTTGVSRSVAAWLRTMAEEAPCAGY